MPYGAAGIGAIEALASAVGQAVSPAALSALTEAQAARASSAATAAAASQGTFQGLVVESLRQANESALQADVAIKNLALGREKNLHHVMIALEEASLSLQFVMQVRNKVIEAYQEVSRMQV